MKLDELKSTQFFLTPGLTTFQLNETGAKILAEKTHLPLVSGAEVIYGNRSGDSYFFKYNGKTFIVEGSEDFFNPPSTERR